MQKSEGVTSTRYNNIVLRTKEHYTIVFLLPRPKDDLNQRVEFTPSRSPCPYQDYICPKETPAMLRPAAFLLLAALLLCPIAAPAQTPISAKAPPRLVALQVTFVAAEVTDVDALGFNFDLLPLPAPPHTFLKYADGNIVAQLYQTLTRTRGKAILIAPAATPDDAPAAISVDAKVPDYTYPVRMSNGPPASSRLLGFFQIQGKLTITPHIIPGSLVNLDIDSAHPGGKPIHFQASPSGGSLVIVAPNTHGADAPILGGLVRLPDTLPNYEELLVFITPTILPTAPTQTSTFVPDKTITLDVINADLRSVVVMLERQANIQAIVQDSDKAYRLVSVHIVSTPVDDAIHTVALSVGMQVTQKPDGVYVFEPSKMIHLATPQTPAKAADLRYRTIVLRHANPADVLKLMHWKDNREAANLNSPNAPADPNLPAGVARIFALQGNNSLLVQATPEGYNQVKNIVKILDVARFGWTMKMRCWTANVNEQELAGLTFEKRDYIDRVMRAPGSTQDRLVIKPMEIASGPAAESLLQNLIAAKRTAVVTVDYEAASTQEWSIGDMKFDEVYLQSDETVAMRWAGKNYDYWEDTVNTHIGSNPPDLAARLILHKNEVIVLRSLEKSTDGQVMFIKTDY